MEKRIKQTDERSKLQNKTQITVMWRMMTLMDQYRKEEQAYEELLQPRTAAYEA